MQLKHKNSKINKSILIAKQLIQAQKRRENLKKQTSSISNDYLEEDSKSIKTINSDESKKYFLNNVYNNNNTKENQSKNEFESEIDCEKQEKNHENSSNFHIGYTINYNDNDETYKNNELMNSDLTIINSNRSYINTMSNKNLNQKELFSLNNQIEIDENQFLTIRIYLFNTNIYLKYMIKHSLSVNVLELKTCLLKTIKENKLFDLKDVDNKHYEIRLTSIRDDNTIGVNYNHPALSDSQEISYSSDWVSLALIRIKNKKTSFPTKESKENQENHMENDKERVKLTLGKMINTVRFLFHIKFYKFKNIKSNPHSNDVYIEEEANEDLTLEMLLERNEKKLKLNQYKKYFYFTLHEHFPMKTTKENIKSKENNENETEFDEEDGVIDGKGNNSFVLDSSQLELSMKISEISIYEIDLYIRKFHDCSIGNINILLLNNNINSNYSVNESTTSSSKRNSETFSQSQKKEETVKEYENNSNIIDNDRVRKEKSSDLYKIEMSSKDYKGFLYNKTKSKGKSIVNIKIDKDYISFTPPKISNGNIKKKETYDYIMGWWDELEYYKYRPIVLIKNIIKYMKIEDCFILIEYKDNFKIKQIYFELEDKLERKDLLYKLKHFMVSL